MTEALIWSYSCRVIDGHEALDRQLRLARDYANERIRNANAEWSALRDIARRTSPALAAAEDAVAAVQAELDAVYEALGAERQRASAIRLRAGESPTREVSDDVAAQLKELKTRRAECYATEKRERSAYNARLKPAFEAFQARKKAAALAQAKAGKAPGPRTMERVHAETLAAMLGELLWPDAWRETMKAQAAKIAADKTARAASALYTATSGLVDDATNRAVSDCRKRREEPRTRGYDGTGRVGGQIRSAPATEDLLRTTGGQLRILGVRPYRQGWQLADCSLRIDSGDGADAWVKLSVLQHRPLPERALVKYAWLKVSGEGRRKRYDLQLVLDVTASPKREAGADGACALHLAFRQVYSMPDQKRLVRVGYVVGTDGLSEPVTLPDAVRAGIDHADKLRGDSDRIFNEARSTLKQLAATTPMPAWVAAEVESLPHWRSHGRLARLAHRWLFGRFARDGQDAVPALTTEERARELWIAWKVSRDGGSKPRDVSWSRWRLTHRLMDLWAPHFEIDAWFVRQGVESAELRAALYLWWWRAKDKHLKEWEDGARKRAELRRRDHYRVLWSRLATRYRTLVVDDMKIAEMKRLPDAEEDDPLSATARLQLTHAAPGSLRELAVDRFGKARVVKVSHKHTADTCSRCGAAFAAEPDNMMGRCASGHRMDRDENAARNVLGREREGGDEKLGVARGSESASEAEGLGEASAAE